MRNRKRNWFLRRLVLGFAVALVAVPVAQAYPDEGAKVQGTFVQGVDDFPGSSELAPAVSGMPVRGEVKDGIGTSPGTAVIVGDDKRGLPTVAVVPVGHPDNRADGTGPSPTAIRIVVPTADAQYNQFAYRRALPEDLGPQAAVLAELDAKTNEYVAGAAPTAAAAELDAKTAEYVAGAAPTTTPVQVVSNASDGFDWGDAGIGAGTIFAVMLLGAGALLATRHVGHPAQV